MVGSSWGRTGVEFSRLRLATRCNQAAGLMETVLYFFFFEPIRLYPGGSLRL